MNERAERFGALYSAHYRAIYAYVYRRLGSHESDVGDVVAEVFTVAWRRLDDVPGSDEELLWLYGVAHRCVLRARRSYSRRARLLHRLGDHVRTRPVDPGLSSREADVLAAVRRLRPRDREVLGLVTWEGLTHAEAATVLGCSVNAVAQRLHTARERLRSQLIEPATSSTDMTLRK